LLSEKQFSGLMRHSAEIFPAITDLLSKFNKKPDQIEHIYVSAGPGSFTGLRIAVTFAKTMALANSAKIVAVDTLDVIAANAATENTEIFSHREKIKNCSAEPAPPIPSVEQLGVILDAKRGQFFIAVYEKTEDKIWKKVLQDSLMTAEEFLARFADKPISLIGEGLVFYKDKFTHKNISVLDEKFWNPSAANVHKLGRQLAQQNQFVDPLTLIPNYIRGPDVTVKQI
jgi:tRNA threonylcarbamoyladenosine biosynthesis protein TsaB